MTTFLSIMGTRPEIIKMAVLQRLLRERGQRALVLHTGQHEDMAEVLYRYFDMAPDQRIALRRSTPSLAHLTSLLLEQVDQALQEIRPDVVLVQGDTTSALAGAVAAYYRGIPLAHVEAGLRTRANEPFPEEKNRELIGRLARWHFAPTRQARSNLEMEGVPPERVFQVGNTVIDTALWVCEQIGRRGGAGETVPLALRNFLQEHPREPLVLVTAHRRENWGAPIQRIAQAVGQIVERHRDAVAVWPLHPNPTIHDDVHSIVSGLSDDCRRRICLTQPLEYPALMAVLTRCHFALTDSGGIQEEASAIARPVLIARNSTERQELVQAGGALLVGTNVERIVEQATRLLTDHAARRSMTLRESPFGDGRAALRIADILAPVRQATP